MMERLFKKIQKKEYLLSAILPAVYFALLAVLSFVAEIPLIPFDLSLGLVIAGILSAVTFMIYIDDDIRLSGLRTEYKYIAAFIYGVSAYLVVRTSSILILSIYALFPVLCMLVKNVIRSGSCLWLIVGMAVISVAGPLFVLPLAICLSVIAVPMCVGDAEKPLYEYLRFLLSEILGLMIGSFRIFSAVTNYKIYGNGYQGFLINYCPLLISFILFAGILFFISSKGKRPADNLYIISVIFLFAVSKVTPLYYFISSGTYSVGEPQICDMVLVFTALIVALRGLGKIDECTKRTRIFIIAVSVLFGMLVLVLLKPTKQSSVAVAAVVVSLIVEIAMAFVICKKSDKNDKAKSVLFILIFAEILFNTLSFSGSQLFCDEVSMMEEIKEAFSVMLPKSAESGEAAEVTADVSAEVSAGGMISPEEYKDFYTSHYDTDIAYIASMLDKYVELSVDEKEQYGVLTGDRFAILNAKCKKAGLSEDLFNRIDDYSLYFTDTKNYRIIEAAKDLFSVEFVSAEAGIYLGEYYYIPFRIKSDVDINENIYLYSESFDYFIKVSKDELNGEKNLYLRLIPQENVDMNYRFPLYSVDPGKIEDSKNTILGYIDSNRHTFIHRIDLFGMAISFIGIVILLICYMPINGKKGAGVVDEKIGEFADNKALGKFLGCVCENRIYILSFAIPALFFISALLVNNCIPFGENSIFDADGSQSILPGFWELGIACRNGNNFFSLNSGYGFGRLMPSFMSAVLMMFKNLSVRNITLLLTMSEGLFIGLSGFTIVYYLTHRLFFNKIDKKELSLLFAALIYSCNYYFVAIRSYSEWYVNLALLPLLILGLERVVKEKKIKLYAITLLLSANVIQLAMYSSFFVVIWFLLEEFESIKDFFVKIIRVGIVSVLALLPCFGMVYTAIGGTSDSHYRENDAIFPMLGFHKSFFDQWKSFMIFSPTEAVNPDDGGLCAYAGIFTFVLLMLFVLNKNIKMRKKIRLLVPVVILLISFNGKVLSFLWNGLHYQSSVPNRYAFLLLFVLAVIAGETIRVFKQYDLFRVIIGFAVIGLVAVLCGILGHEENSLSVAASVIVLIIWIFASGIALKTSADSKAWMHLFVIILSVELFVAHLYAWSEAGVEEILRYGNVDEERAILGKLRKGTEFQRVSFPNSGMVAGGFVYGVPTLAYFSPYVSIHQTEMSYLFGYIDGSNWLIDRTDSTPFANSLEGTGLLLVSKFSRGVPMDLDHYEYVGETGRFYVYRNPDALSLGVYMPEDIEEIVNDYGNTPTFYNEMVRKITGDEEKLFNIGAVGDEYKGLQFKDLFGNDIPIKETEDIYNTYKDEDVTSQISELRMKIEYTPKKSGWMYLYNIELSSLGYANEGEEFLTEIAYPNTRAYNTAFNIAVLNEDTYKRFIEKESRNQVEDMVFNNDTISGTVDYEEDGYTMFSIAYDPDFKAYLDGEEVPIEDLLKSAMFIKTPKGKHSVALKYEPETLFRVLILSGVLLLLDIVILNVYERRRIRNERQNV